LLPTSASGTLAQVENRLLLPLMVTWFALSPGFAQEIRARDAGNWDGGFAVPGVQGSVMAMAFDKKRIYIGGALQSVGRVKADAVGAFSGNRWRALPHGPQQEPNLFNVMTMTMFQERLYVGGFFTNAGRMPAGGLANWNGIRWKAPGGVTNGEVLALRNDGQSLLVGGRFSVPGITNPVALARFDGTKWFVLNSELTPTNEVVRIDNINKLEVLPDGTIVAQVSFFNRL